MTASAGLIHAVCWALGWTLVHFLWQGCLITMVLACVLGLVPRQRAQVRYVLCCVALVLMVAAPLGTFVRLIHASVHAQAMEIHAVHEAAAPVVDGSAPRDSVLQRVVGMIDHAMPALLVLWMMGVVVLMGRAGMGLVVARRMKRVGVLPVSAELERSFRRMLERLPVARSVQLMQSALVQVPTVVGWLRPVILVPVGLLTGLSVAQVEAVLLHELAHIRRHDYLVSVLQAMTEAVLFYHPAVWWVSKRIRREREHCCDDLAVAIAGNPVVYARALSLLEERRSINQLIPLTATGGVLTMRIQRILGLAKEPVRPQPAAVLLLGVLIAGVSVTAMVRAQAPAPSQTVAGISADESQVPKAYRAWVDQDVRWIIKPEERAAFLRLNSDAERNQFIQQFWLRRDAVGAAPNSFRAEYYRRIAYANAHFAQDGTPGWKTDRGRIYIVYGAPTSIDAHPSGVGNEAKPFEVWDYDGRPDGGQLRELRFVDTCNCGRYEVVDGDAH